MDLAASLLPAGCIPDKEPSKEVEACLHEDGPGLSTGWGIDILRWACAVLRLKAIEYDSAVIC